LEFVEGNLYLGGAVIGQSARNPWIYVEIARDNVWPKGLYGGQNSNKRR
jgi:hypothetical protein